MFDSGAYANHPNDAAPCGVKKPAEAMSPPNRYSQYANMFSRGNATSGAPICSGMMTFAKPANSGVANSSSMIVPCMVNSWLYCSLLCTIWMPGSKSSARITRAMRPPMQKKMNDVIRYMYPIVLWSVEVTHLMTVRPSVWRFGRETRNDFGLRDHQFSPSVTTGWFGSWRRFRSSPSSPIWPLSSSFCICASYSARETTATLKSMPEWCSPQSSAHLPA